MEREKFFRLDDETKYFIVECLRIEKETLFKFNNLFYQANKNLRVAFWITFAVASFFLGAYISLNIKYNKLKKTIKQQSPAQHKTDSGEVVYFDNVNNF